jgi:predicted secreted protein
MVHRPTDSRLLANLLSQEKEYSKQLGTVLETSQASLSSFSAYASASAPPVSQVILAVAGALAGADEALQKYLEAVDEWRDQLKRLKDLELEVGNIVRDREIL